MANWYSGVLKSVSFIFSTIYQINPAALYSTGKRRYGHPALLGVLPEPWLPLKKGQTLVSGNGNGRPGMQPMDSSQAVVLNLRKRFSMVRRGVRQMSPGRVSYSDNGHRNGDDGAHELTMGTSERPPGGPWPSVRRTQTTPQPLHHRLSYDHASGVIMLPEGESWLMEDGESDSEDDYGRPSPPNEEVSTSPLVESAPGATRSVPPDQSPASSPSKRRSVYSTYYHHPERRTRTVPGAFEVE